MKGKGGVGGLLEGDEHNDQSQHALSISDGQLNLAYEENSGWIIWNDKVALADAV